MDEMKVSMQDVLVHSAHKIVYILVNNNPIASVQIINEPIAISKQTVDADWLKEQAVATVSVNCKKEQVLASYQKYFK